MNNSNHLPTEYQQFIHLSRYSRYIWNENRRETYPETVARYFDFFVEDLKEKHDYTITKEEREELENAVLNQEVMPSMRCLMSAGPALKKENVAGYNCSYLAIDRVQAFDELLYILMNGTGVGFSVERQHVSKLPIIAEDFYDTDIVINVSDSKIGWAKSLKELMALLYQGQVPSWDVSKVRAAGEVLKTFGGRASGPEPLDDLFRFTIETFRKAAGRKLTSVECHDIVCKIAEIVVVGGVRRSALISLSSLTDERMRDAKSGAWWEANAQRALANNSVVYRERPEIGTFMDEWISLYKSKSGERGIFNRDAAKKQCERAGQFRGEKYRQRDPDFDFGTNPCCLPGDTLIETNLGQIPIREVVLSPEDFLVKTFNHETESVEMTEIISGDMTRLDAELVELEIENENGETITLKLTPDHKVYTENRGYICASDLLEDDVVLVSKNYKYATGISSKESSYETGNKIENNVVGG